MVKVRHFKLLRIILLPTAILELTRSDYILTFATGRSRSDCDLLIISNRLLKYKPGYII